jgi:general secretion pathway protein I
MTNKWGFTLIEVLVALAILSIALMAVIKVGSQNIRDTFYIQEKTIALWVATDVINEVRAGLIKVPVEPDALQEKKEILNQQLTYEVSLQETPNPRIKKIEVDVYNTIKLIHLESYMYAQ